MVQLMNSDTNSLKRVKLELQDSGKYELGALKKRPKLNSSHKNPLDEPSPLGLRLRKSPSLLDLIQMRLSKEDSSRLATANTKASAGTLDAKLKASNFPASLLKIGTWEYKSRYEGDLVAKCYFAKHKLVWEVLDGCLKSKIEIPWSDIMALKASYPDDGPGTLEVVLARRPLYFKEINPQPRKHTLWQATSDFTGGQASIQRKHFLQCPQGFLGKHFEKLIQCDHRLNFLSQQPNMDIESASAVQSSSTINQHNLQGIAVESFCQETTLPSSVKDTDATEEFWSREVSNPNFLSNMNQSKVSGLHPSMFMTDLVSQIEHYISEQTTSGCSTFEGDNQNKSSVLKEITQYLFSDSRLTVSPDEQFLISRINSMCCLLQSDPSTTKDTNNTIKKDIDAANSGKIVDMNPTLTSPCKFKGQQDDASDCKQRTGIPRKESVGELLLNLPRIASLPELLFHMSEDSGNRVR